MAVGTFDYLPIAIWHTAYTHSVFCNIFLAYVPYTSNALSLAFLLPLTLWTVSIAVADDALVMLCNVGAVADAILCVCFVLVYFRFTRRANSQFNFNS